MPPLKFSDSNDWYALMDAHGFDHESLGHAASSSTAGRIVRSLLEGACEPSIIIDPMGLLTYANAAWVERWGYPNAGAVIGRPADQYFRSKAAFGPEPVVAALDGCDWRGQVVCKHFNGSEVELACSTCAILAEDGSALCVVARFQESIVYSADAVDTRQFQELIINAAGVLVLVLDHEGRFLRFNAECERASGWREAEVLGLFPWETVLPQDVASDIRRKAFDEVVAGEDETAKHRFVNEWLGRDGSRRLIEWTNTLIRPTGSTQPVMVCIGVDITERHRADTVLKQHKEQLKRAQSVAQVGSWSLDLGTGRLEWTAQVYAIFEVDRREFAGTYDAFLARVHPDDRAAVDDAFRQFIESHSPYRVEHRLIMPDGRIKWVEERCEASCDDLGALVWVEGTVQDITERHRMHAQLNASVVEMRALLNAFPGAVACVDDELRYCSVNEGACQIIGLDEKQVLGRTVDEVRGPIEAARLRDINIRLLAGESVRRELKYIGPGGQVREYLVQYRLSDVLDSACRHRFFAYATDVTESRQNESRLNAIVEATGIGTWEWNQVRKELLVNSQIATMLGYEPSEVPSSPNEWIDGIIHPDDRVRRNEQFRTLKSEGTQGIDIEARIRHKQGHWLVVFERVTVAARGADGLPIVLFGTVQDVTTLRAQQTELKTLNENLEARIAQRTSELAAAKLDAERANAAKSEFLSRMSHELRTPLNAVVGFGQLLEIARLPPDEAENVGEILRAGHHLLGLINEILDLATVSSGQIVMQHHAVPLRSLVGECVQLVRPMANDHGILIDNLVDADCALVRADRGRLKQVLLNLLSNAIKYNRPHGRVAIECDCSRAGICELQVKDNGPGLSASQVKRLFQPFDRLGPPDQSVQGTGIGLSVSKQLVELMDGSIGAHSSLGEGTTFWVRLPLSEPEDTPYASDLPWPVTSEFQTLDGRGSRQVVLYVEDNAANQRLMQRFFARREDVDLVVAADPHAALLMAQQISPALLLLDIRLPGMDGYELLAKLRAVGIGAPAVAISANAMPTDLEQGRNAGFSDYLTKPLSMGQVMAVADVFLKDHGADTAVIRTPPAA